METPTKTSLHPVLWIAAIAVTLFSLVGIAKLTGLLPSAQPDAPLPATAATAPEPPPPPAVAPAPEPAPIAVAPAKPAAPKPVVKKKTTTYSSNPTEPMSGSTYSSAPVPPPPCPTCGVIDAIAPVTQKGEGSGLGAVAGGIVGGLLGNQVGRGTGRDIATIGGLVGGAFAGNAVEKNVRTQTVFDVTVRFTDGGSQVFRENTRPIWQIGDRVRVENGQILPR